MTLSLTAVTRNQWEKVGTVALWVILTNGVGILTAWLTAKPEFLAIGPALNVAGKAVQQIFQNEEDQAIGQLPPQVIQPDSPAIPVAPPPAINTPLGAAPIVAAPVTFTGADKAADAPLPPNIGSTANS